MSTRAKYVGWYLEEVQAISIANIAEDADLEDADLEAAIMKAVHAGIEKAVADLRSRGIERVGLDEDGNIARRRD